MVRHHQHTNTPPLVSVLLALFCAFVPPIIGGCSPLRDSCSCECFNIFIIICTNNMAASFNQTLKAHFHSIKKQIFQFKTWEWYCPTHTAAPVEAGLVAKRHQRGSERTDTHHTVTYCDTLLWYWWLCDTHCCQSHKSTCSYNRLQVLQYWRYWQQN